MKHWRMEDVAWDEFDPGKVKADLIPLMKAAALVERNAADYAIYLGRVFPDDPEFRAAIDRWSIEEVQHGEALGRWGMLADPGWDFEDAFRRFREGYQVPLDVDASVRGSRTGELIARCIVETGTSSYYTALAQTTEEPVMASICKLIAADEYRHFKLFYEHMRRYLDREQISFLKRLRIAAGRIGESEDDEMAYAYHCANKSTDAVYDHRQCIAVYMSTTVPIYRFGHVERVMGMVFKAVGLKPRGRLSDVSARVAWHLLQRRGRKMAELVTPDVQLSRAA